MPESAFPDRIGIGDGPEIPCRFVAFDFARTDVAPPIVGHRDADGTVHIDDRGPETTTARTFTVEQARFTAERTGRYDFSGLRSASDLIVNISAPPNSCSRCGIEERGHGEEHAYIAPADVLRLARMKARRGKRLNPPRRIRPTPEMIGEFTVNLGAYGAAITRAFEGLSEAARTAGDRFREFAAVVGTEESAAEDWANYVAYYATYGPTAPRELRLSPDAEPGPALDRGEPLTDADANWPTQGGTCAHVCGPDPDHRCDARATTRLAYSLPSGGTRSMPICGPCHQSETAAPAVALNQFGADIEHLRTSPGVPESEIQRIQAGILALAEPMWWRMR
jgi:hypothetical protein